MGFNDMVVSEAEATILTATVDELVSFAYGGWDEAEAGWQRRQRARFLRRRPRPTALDRHLEKFDLPQD